MKRPFGRRAAERVMFILDLAFAVWEGAAAIRAFAGGDTQTGVGCAALCALLLAAGLMFRPSRGDKK